MIRFGHGALSEAPELLSGAGFDHYTLLTTERALAAAPGLAGAAAAVVHVPAGRVDEISAQLIDQAGDRPLLALGGGRVVDTAKAIAGAQGSRSAAVPTTLSGAEMTGLHRTPAGVEGARLTRPALVVADPDLMATRPLPALAASAMNALGHAMESLYTPLANPVAELAALRAAELIGAALPYDDPPRGDLALAALLAGYAVGSAGFAVHHAVCQSLVRVAGSPHAETNAVMLPHFARLMAGRAPAAVGALAEALGDPERTPDAAAADIARLAARSGHLRLSTLGVAEDQLERVVEAALQHPALGNTPQPPDADELRAVLERAL